ncbi:hypothetical protein GCM10011376_06590 [Nocardioides flavus (ex Wang et al. 2016)]|uniref:Uncharacterized protein n=1 Tax=Nocardioides flavus (ex Wang et al. 2016) TaxID=2058780 RepID=A0ABQ3HIY5_9ACTN|nr:hypothetical protein [Nocardioides flavus (ex Wang et al. 2016)]GHE15949.1 hypothetical protein GCM10011376_06590 [Nocardioides flavus (ex Wang et al. 2016)]
MTTSGAGRVHGWVAHLRAGGTTPWRAWTGDAEPVTRTVPGAQQLELLRRINSAADIPVPTALADRVLAAPAAGRGKADLPLVGGPASSFGPRPVDPSLVGPHELLRVASVLLADDLVELGPDPVRATWARPWRRRYRLVGDPVVTVAAREHLRGRGRPEGGPRPFVVAVGAPLDVLLAHTWTQRCFENGSKPWGDWLRYWRERDQLPARVDLLDSVRRWDARSPLVRVVTDLDRLPRQVGVRHLPEVRVPGADQAELARRVAAVVGLRVPAAERPALMRTLQRRIPDTGVAPVAVPPAEHAWVAASAARLTRHLSRAGYPVVGDLADLAPHAAPAAATGPDDQQVLDLAIAMVVDPAWRTRRTAGHTTEGQVER